MADESGSGGPPRDEASPTDDGDAAGGRSVGVDGPRSDSGAADGPGGDRWDEGEEGADHGVAGRFAPEASIEPGTPSLESTAWVTFGALVATLALGRLFVAEYGATDVLAIAGATVLVAVAFAAFFGTLTPDT